MHDAGASKAEIATELGRARSTIGREITWSSRLGEDSAVIAQQRRHERPLPQAANPQSKPHNGKRSLVQLSAMNQAIVAETRSFTCIFPLVSARWTPKS